MSRHLGIEKVFNFAVWFVLPVEDSISSSIAKMIVQLRSGYISGVRWGPTNQALIMLNDIWRLEIHTKYEWKIKGNLKVRKYSCTSTDPIYPVILNNMCRLYEAYLFNSILCFTFQSSAGVPFWFFKYIMHDQSSFYSRQWWRYVLNNK